MKHDDPDSKLPVPTLCENNPETYLDGLNHYLALSFSLPERIARALGSLIGGSTLLLTKTLIPTAVKNSNSYRFTFGMFQAFLIKNVAQLDDFHTDTELQEHFLNRKLLGTSLEAAGLLTMHLSPVWVFAIASDAAKGGQVFLNRLVHHLKEHDVILEESNPDSLEQVLLAIHVMGRQGATAIDTPPLSMVEVEELAAQLRESTASLRRNSANLLPRFEAIWSQIDLVVKKENLSTEQVLGMLSVSAASIARTSVGTAGAIGKTGFYFLDEIILNDYKETLVGIMDTGSLRYMQQNMQPFVQNAQAHFNFKIETRSQIWFKNSITRLMRRIQLKK
ncbi:MAG: hypothetical protein COB20_08505 [SAR86 cluster bacterium]|uniref:Uncharacterized protein n=1 Tax=SAR86 cluster bacterium TaxID=2030880 RepID=A0A2A4X4L6_9GAMM|nr:MAG: hypothetical protein COB20_08505 [SAR86 cluster bacterium]